MTIACTLDRSVESNDGCSSMRAIWVGIPPRKLTPCVATAPNAPPAVHRRIRNVVPPPRSEEHTSELQSRFDLVCRLLLAKKKKTMTTLFFKEQKKKIDYNNYHYDTL